jgi:hypothetical protein
MALRTCSSWNGSLLSLNIRKYWSRESNELTVTPGVELSCSMAENGASVITWAWSPCSWVMRALSSETVVQVTLSRWGRPSCQ